MNARGLLLTMIFSGVFVSGLSAQTWRTEPTDDTYTKASK